MPNILDIEKIALTHINQYYWAPSRRVTPTAMSPFPVRQEKEEECFPDPDNTNIFNQVRRDFIAAFRYGDKKAIKLIINGKAVINCDQFLHVILWKAGFLKSFELTQIANAPSNFMDEIFAEVPKYIYTTEAQGKRNLNGHIVWISDKYYKLKHIGINCGSGQMVSLSETCIYGEIQHSVNICQFSSQIENRRSNSKYFHTDMDAYLNMLRTLLKRIPKTILQLPKTYPLVYIGAKTPQEVFPEKLLLQAHSSGYVGLELDDFESLVIELSRDPLPPAPIASSSAAPFLASTRRIPPPADFMNLPKVVRHQSWEHQ